MASTLETARCTALATAVVLASGCFLGSYDSAYIEADDVALALPRGEDARDATPGVYALIGSDAARVNALVGGLVERTSVIVGDLNDLRENRREGRARVYGPFSDEIDPSLSWTVTIRDDDAGTEYQVDVGEGQNTTLRLLDARVDVEDGLRSGSFELDLSVLETFPGLVESNSSPGPGMRIDGRFTRTDDGQRTVELEVHDGQAEERYGFEQDSDGGSISVDGRLLIPEPFLTREARQVEFRARWNESAAARARGSIEPEAGDDAALPHGALLLDECFDPAGELTFRGVNEAYAAVFGVYTVGDPSTCAISEEGL